MSKLRSELTGKTLAANEHEFRVWNFPYKEGEIYSTSLNNRYLVIAIGNIRNEGKGNTSCTVVIREVR